MSAKAWALRAVIFATICLEYEKRGLPANAEWFRVNAVYCVAQSIKLLALESMR